MSLNDLQNRYKGYIRSQCNWGRNLINPSLCDASPIYMKKFNKFLQKQYNNSVKDTKENQEKLLIDRKRGDKHKDIYPINNHDFDYKTAYVKKLNPFNLGITNEPSIDNLWRSPVKLMKYYEGLVKNRYPNKNTISGYDDVILDDKRKVQIKNTYRAMNEKPPYPTFRKDYPECRYPTTGENASSYFIKIGKCKSNITDKKKCNNMEFEWVENKKKFPKIAVDLASTKKGKKSAVKHIKGTCYKPQFAYIDNKGRGFMGQNGLAPSLVNDLLNISPDKLANILAGNSIDGSGILPCVEDFTNMVEKKHNNKSLCYVSIFFIILAILYFIYTKISH